MVTATALIFFTWGTGAMSVNRSNFSNIIGFPVVSSDGDVIGEAERVYLDEESDRPIWLSVRVSLFRTTEYVVPLAGARTSSEGVWVKYDKNTVKDAPRVAVKKRRLSPPDAAELSRYYGLAV
jgi:hypothetical protein